MKTVLLALLAFIGLAALFSENPIFNPPAHGDRIGLVSLYPEEEAIMLPGEKISARVNYRIQERDNLYIIARLYPESDSYRYSSVYEVSVSESDFGNMSFAIPHFTGPVGEKVFAVDFALVERSLNGDELVISRTQKYEYVMADTDDEEYYDENEDEDDGDGFIELAIR